MSNRSTEYQRWMHEHGICPRCRKKDEYTKMGYWLCAECARKANSQRAAYYQEHREELLTKQRKKREERKRNGVCVACGKRPVAKGMANCEECLKKKREWNKGDRERKKWR